MMMMMISIHSATHKRAGRYYLNGMISTVYPPGTHGYGQTRALEPTLTQAGMQAGRGRHSDNSVDEKRAERTFES